MAGTLKPGQVSHNKKAATAVSPTISYNKFPFNETKKTLSFCVLAGIQFNLI